MSSSLSTVNGSIVGFNNGNFNWNGVTAHAASLLQGDGTLSKADAASLTKEDWESLINSGFITAENAQQFYTLAIEAGSSSALFAACSSGSSNPLDPTATPAPVDPNNHSATLPNGQTISFDPTLYSPEYGSALDGILGEIRSISEAMAGMAVGQAAVAMTKITILMMKFQSMKNAGDKLNSAVQNSAAN